MTDLLRWGKKIDAQELAELETLLQSALLPLPPRRTYGQELRQRLANSAPVVEFPEPQWSRYWFLTLIGMVLGLLVVIWGLKALHFSLASRKRRFIAAGG